MNHAELVERAERWLRNTLNCGVVLSELVAYTRSGETPDAIGWVWSWCILVECKTSRSDYFADQKKRARHPQSRALGQWRFYMTPPGLIKPEEVPEGWGLYEVHGRSVKHIAGERFTSGHPQRPPFVSDKESEIAMLLSALRRLKKESEA